MIFILCYTSKTFNWIGFRCSPGCFEGDHVQAEHLVQVQSGSGQCWIQDRRFLQMIELRIVWLHIDPTTDLFNYKSTNCLTSHFLITNDPTTNCLTTTVLTTNWSDYKLSDYKLSDYILIWLQTDSKIDSQHIDQEPIL